MSMETHHMFNRRSGEILRLAVSIEAMLEHFITDFFCNNPTKTNLLEDVIIHKLDFERKIVIFDKICKYIKYDSMKLKKIIRDIRFVQINRNKVAHYESSYREDPNNPEIAEVTLWPRKSMKKRDESLVLTEEEMDKINRGYFSMYKGITDVQNYLIEIQNQSESNLKTD